MNLARTMGAVIGFLAVFTYGHVISARLSALILFLFAVGLVYWLVIWPNLRRGK
jgi:hypothetical protein